MGICLGQSGNPPTDSREGAVGLCRCALLFTRQQGPLRASGKTSDRKVGQNGQEATVT